MGSKYNKMRLRPRIAEFRNIFGTLRAWGTCLVAENVVVPEGEDNSAPTNPLAGFEGPLYGREKRKKD